MTPGPNPPPPTPAFRQVLASLHILGRGNVYDDMTQLSFMSESMACVTFHKFCKFFARDLYDAHVRLPTGEALERVMLDYHKLGFTGAVGSTDVTHVKWACCPYSQARNYTGKEGFPTIAYQLTVDHSGRALAVTEGFEGSQNDKTIIRYDAAVKMIRDNPQYKDRTFVLYNSDGTWSTVKGVYLIVDNGYHKVSRLQYMYRNDKIDCGGIKFSQLHMTVSSYRCVV